jgi:hypothetical protein
MRGKGQPYRKKASQNLSKLILGKDIRVEYVQIGRKVA